MSRQYTLLKLCVELGCKEYAHFTYDTRAEYIDGEKRNRGWLCSRHAKPDEVLSATAPTLERTLVSRRGAADKLYWDGFSGFTFGPGFKAWADDFPEGTRLVVTARIEPPASQGTAGERGEQHNG